jgi:hypothetical protein
MLAWAVSKGNKPKEALSQAEGKHNHSASFTLYNIISRSTVYSCCTDLGKLWQE